MVDRPGVVALLIASLAFSAGCKKPAPPPPVVDAGPPRDHLAPGEVPEGREKAFALVLPYRSNIQFKTADAIVIESPLRPEELSNFVRARVQTNEITAGAGQTTFGHAVVPAEPKRILQIEIRPAQPSHDMRSAMTVRDVTPPSSPAPATEEEAWRKAGRGPDGKPLDQNHMF